MRPGRAIRAALGLCLTGSLVLGCNSGSTSNAEKADDKPVTPNQKPMKSRATGKMITKQDRMPSL